MRLNHIILSVKRNETMADYISANALGQFLGDTGWSFNRNFNLQKRALKRYARPKGDQHILRLGIE